MTVIEHLG